MGVHGYLPNLGIRDVLGAIALNGTNGPYTLRDIAGTAITPGNAEAIAVYIGGVFQRPNVAYTVVGTQITFTSTNPVVELASGITCWILRQGQSLDIGIPGANTVGPNNIISGWQDNVVTFLAGKTTGSADPTWAAYNGTNLYTWQFSPTVIQELQLTPMHFNHNLKPNTNLYPHIHWMPDTADAGTVRWGIEYTAARGFSQDAFPAAQIIYIEQAAAGVAHTHQIAEIPDPGWDNSSGVIEPDSIIMLRIFRDATHVNDTYPGLAHGLALDCHYQVDRVSTPNKAPNFYA